MAEDRALPGWPKKRLVKAVRSHLSCYGIRPQHTVWHATWTWASAIANSYVYIHWPIPSEIASQYVFLLLGEMNSGHSLKLPYRAGTVVPDVVRKLLSELPMALPDNCKGKPKRIGHAKAK
jgi:hypothetical protein